MYGHLRKIDEAALWELLLFLSIFIVRETLRPRNTLGKEVIEMANRLRNVQL